MQDATEHGIAMTVDLNMQMPLLLLIKNLLCHLSDNI